MAPGLRSGRTGHPEVAVVGADGAEPGGCSPQRTDAGGKGRCLRTGSRAGSAGMLANCLLSVAALLLLVRCALAAEEKSTFDASGSSPLPSDPAVTGARAHPLANLSGAEEVHSDGDTESEGEGLSGRPAFSSVLTVMAETVKHPVSLGQSRTLPTITRDETHTTQWPSHSSSQAPGMSSSLSSLASFMDGSKNVSSYPSSTARPAPSMSSVLSSPVSQSSSTEWRNETASSKGQKAETDYVPQTETATLSPAESQGLTDSLATAQSTTHSVVALPAIIQEMQSTTTKPSHFQRETASENSNNRTKHSFYSSLDQIHEVSEIYLRSANTKANEAPSTSTYTSYSTPNYYQNLLNILYGPTQTQNQGIKSASASNLEVSTSFHSSQGNQAVQRREGASHNPASAQPPAPRKDYSVSGHVTEQMFIQTAYMEKEEKAAADSHTFVHKLSSHLLNPTVSPAFFTASSETPPGRTSLSETADAELTRIHSGMVSSEHASNPGDLLMAAGRSSPSVPAINVIYSQGEVAGAELRPVSAQAHLNNSLSLPVLTPEATAGSILNSVTRTGATLSPSESHLPDLQRSNVRTFQESVTQTLSSKGITQEHKEWTALKLVFSSNSKTISLSEPVELAKDMTYKVMHESHSQLTQPAYLFLSNSPNHNNSENISFNSEVNFADDPKAVSSPQTERPLQTRSLHGFLHNIHTPGLFSKISEPTVVSSPETSAHIKSDGAAETQTSTRNNKTLQVAVTHMSHENDPIQHLHSYNAKGSMSPSFNGNEASALIRDSAFYKKDIPPGQFATHFPSSPSKAFLMLNKGSEGKISSADIPFPPVTFDSALEPLKTLSHKDDVTLVDHYEQSSPSSWSKILLTQRPNTSSSSQGPIISVSSDKSNFYLGRQTAIASTASSAVATSSSDGQNGMETLSAIFSFGTKLMAPYTKWKATKPMPFQSSVFKSENTSTGFDRAKSNLPADGPSYEQPKLEDGQMRVLNSTAATSDPYPLYPTVGEYPSFTFVKGTADYKKPSLNLSPADLRSAAPVRVQHGATLDAAATSAWGSDVFLPHSHTNTDSVTSSQATSLALGYESKHSSPQAGVPSPESAFDSAATHPDSNPDGAGNATDLIMKTSTLPYDQVSSISSFRLPSPPSTFPSPSSSHMNPTILVSSLTVNPADMISSTTPTTYPATASLSVSVKVVQPTFSSSSSPSLTSSLDSVRSQELTKRFVLSEAEMDELTAGTSRAVVLTSPKEKDTSLAPSQSVRTTLSAGLTERTSQVSPLTPQQDTTTASVKFTTTTPASATKTKTTPSLRVTTQLTTTTTPQPTLVTRRATTTIRTQTSRRTFTQPVPRTSPPRVVPTVFISPFTTTTEAPPQQCNITERMWVKTVVSIYVRRNRLDSIQRQNLRRGLSQGLRKALNDTAAQAQVETVFGSPNMTVAYHVTGGDIVYPPSVVLEGLASYGRDKLIADLRQYLPMVTALPLPVALWRINPATGFQLKTVLQFVGAGDDPRSCRFSQMMEQRLEKVFSEAQAKVLSSNSRLSVQILSVSQAAGSPAVSLVYTVKNGTVLLNGTAASNLLGQLSAELVGYFLFYPPLIIAEPLEYHNLNTSIATRDFWVVTVIQDVDNASLEGQYQSFANLMEQRLAELFVLAGQQGTRFRRATTVGSFTVQMVSIRRVSGLKNPAEMTYYVQHNGVPISGASAAKILNTVDSQTMALTLGYFVQLQAEPVVKNPPNNLWIIAAVLAPISVVTLIIIIITAVLCRKNKNDFKADAIGNLNPRAKMAYRRDVGYYHQPVQGFDYAKQHLGQQGGDEETLPVSQDTLVMSLQIRDTPLSLEKGLQQDGTANKKSLTADKRKSKLPSEDGSVISNESEKLNSGRGLTVPKVTAQQKLTKEELCNRDDPYDTSSGSLQLISIKPMVAQNNYSHPASSDRSQDSVIINGEVNLALKQKSDIEHYRNKLRLKAKRKGYYDFPSTNGSGSGRAVAQRQRPGHERAAGEHGRPLEPDDERGSTYVKSHRRHSQVGQTAYRSRQSLSSPSPGGTEMDLLVMRERPRRGIRNSGYDTEPELIEETNVDRLMGPRGYMYGRGLKGHSETSTLSSQPSIDEVRQQMHLLLEEAFSLASGGQSTSGRHSHHHHQPPPDHYSSAPPPLPYADVVTSAPGTMSCGRGGLQWVPSYGADMYQCSLPKPAFRFTQLPEMATGSPPPLPPRTGPPPGTSLRRSTSDLGPKARSSETSVAEMRSQHDSNPYGPTTRAALPSITGEQPVSNYSGNPITAVYAIPASRSSYSEYFVSTPPTSYHSPSWMSYPPEPEDVPPQWADSVPLPGYVEAFPHPRYPQGSPIRLPLQYNQTLEQPPSAPSTASQQSLPQVLKDMDSMPLSSLSTSALVQAIRQEVAKLAKKQNDMFEF